MYWCVSGIYCVHVMYWCVSGIYCVHVMYLCVSGIHFSSFYDFYIWSWNCSYIVVFFYFIHSYNQLGKCLALFYIWNILDKPTRFTQNSTSLLYPIVICNTMTYTIYIHTCIYVAIQMFYIPIGVRRSILKFTASKWFD
jgi:hypothetical protein